MKLHLVTCEANEMLSKGFKEKSYDACRFFPPSTQLVLISITPPIEVLDMAQSFINDPIKVLLDAGNVIHSKIFIMFWIT